MEYVSKCIQNQWQIISWNCSECIESCGQIKVTQSWHQLFLNENDKFIEKEGQAIKSTKCIHSKSTAFQYYYIFLFKTFTKHLWKIARYVALCCVVLKCIVEGSVYLGISFWICISAVFFL